MEAVFKADVVPGAAPEVQEDDELKDVADRPSNTHIGDEAQAVVKQLTSEVLMTLVEEVLDDFLRASYHNVQSGMKSVDYNAVEQVMLELIRENVISET